MSRLSLAPQQVWGQPGIQETLSNKCKEETKLAMQKQEGLPGDSPFREEFPVWGSGLGAFEQLPQILCDLRYRDRLAPDHTVVLKFYSMPSTAALSLPYPFQHWLTAAPAAATGSPWHWDEVFIPISPPPSPTVAGSHSGYSQFPEQRCVRTSR